MTNASYAACEKQKENPSRGRAEVNGNWGQFWGQVFRSGQKQSKNDDFLLENRRFVGGRSGTRSAKTLAARPKTSVLRHFSCNFPRFNGAKYEVFFKIGGKNGGNQYRTFCISVRNHSSGRSVYVFFKRSSVWPMNIFRASSSTWNSVQRVLNVVRMSFNV